MDFYYKGNFPPSANYYYRNFHPITAKNSPKVLPFEKMYLLLRCILSKVKII